MISDGLLDKHGRPNENTPADFVAGYQDYSKMAPKTETTSSQQTPAPAIVKQEPADGDEATARKVSGEKKIVLSLFFIIANIKILGIMLISQMIKGCKEKFFINQIFDENIRRLHQGKKVFRQKMVFRQKKTSPCSILTFNLSTFTFVFNCKKIVKLTFLVKLCTKMTFSIKNSGTIHGFPDFIYCRETIFSNKLIAFYEYLLGTTRLIL